MSEEDRRILSYVMRDAPGNAAMVGEAVRILARRALGDGSSDLNGRHCYFWLGRDGEPA